MSQPMYHYYHVTLTAEVVYPNGLCNSAQPVLAIAWKYLWSDSPTESGDIAYTDREFREGLHEWYQLSAYNLTDNRKAFCQAGQGAPARSSNVDIFQLLYKAGYWHEDVEMVNGCAYLLGRSSLFNNTVNARASLGRPALKAWYAGGRSMPPLIYFEGMSLYFNPGVSGDLNKYTVRSVNALGNDSGPIYTYYDHIDEDGSLDDRESISVPVATRKTTDNDDKRFCDNEYRVVTGRFSGYDSADQSLTRVTASAETIGAGPLGHNAVFHYVPFTANTAKVELQGCYYSASNPIVKAVLAIPPFNKATRHRQPSAAVSVWI